jgi:hypothetical protein
LVLNHFLFDKLYKILNSLKLKKNFKWSKNAKLFSTYYICFCKKKLFNETKKRHNEWFSREWVQKNILHFNYN